MNVQQWHAKLPRSFALGHGGSTFQFYIRRQSPSPIEPYRCCDIRLEILRQRYGQVVNSKDVNDRDPSCAMRRTREPRGWLFH